MTENEITDQLFACQTLGGLDGLTAWTGVSARGIEVWVRQTDDVERALAFIEEHEEFQSKLEDRGVVFRPVLAFCEHISTQSCSMLV